MRRPPSPLEPWYGPERNFGYLAEVQPVFDKHCVSCHDYGQEAGQKPQSGRRPGAAVQYVVRRAAEEEVREVPGAGPFQTLLPQSWGSHASPLVEVLLHGHGDPAIDRAGEAGSRKGSIAS